MKFGSHKKLTYPPFIYLCTQLLINEMNTLPGNIPFDDVNKLIFSKKIECSAMPAGYCEHGGLSK